MYTMQNRFCFPYVIAIYTKLNKSCHEKPQYIKFQFVQVFWDRLVHIAAFLQSGTGNLVKKKIPYLPPFWCKYRLVTCNLAPSQNWTNLP